MHARILRTLSATFLLAVGCTPGEPGTTDVSTTDVSTTGTSTGNTTGEPTTNDTTGEPTTMTPTTGGVSESATGSTGGESSTGVGPSTSTGTVEETSSSTGDGSSSTGAGESSTGDAALPVSFDECREGDAKACPDEDPACLVVDGPGGGDPNGSFFVTWSYCTRECDSDADCVSEEQGGTAKPRCVPKGPNQVNVCVLDCSFGKQCPATLECSNDETCGTRFCDCKGTGCQDFLCTGE